MSDRPTQQPEWAHSLRAELQELRRELADVRAQNARMRADQIRAEAAQRLHAADLEARLDARMASLERVVSLIMSDRGGDEGASAWRFASW